ncbi:D111/G-patch domain-containing protein [Actinidia rufa]|uniref:D111/G-patch domain-containing protein n=1 Tax=Actinidia rufa TaxID=165716 RepID=A0A7J0FSJ7_9ERIC|nr:D111/G-patch domain-containing protein [Actinidia rufa]
MSYGINLCSSSDLASNTEAKNPESVEMVMLRKLKDDLSRLPDDVSLDEYAEMPVEGFGVALLAGYGWYEGRGIGRKPKGDVKVVQYENRTAKEGVLEVVGTCDWVVLKTLRTDEKLKVRIGNVAELGLVEEERCLKEVEGIEDSRVERRTGSDDGRRPSKLGHRESKGEGIVEKRKDSELSREEGVEEVKKEKI